MDDSAFDKLPEHLKEKVRQSREAYSTAIAISKSLTDKFTICNLQVAATTNGHIVVSGLTDTEGTKREVTNFLEGAANVQSVTNNLSVVNNRQPAIINVNGAWHVLASLTELQSLFAAHSEGDHFVYKLTGYGKSRLILLLNRTHSLGIYLRFDGDSGYTTCNPKGNRDKKQEFLLTNGQLDEFEEDLLVDIKTAHDIMRYYLLTGSMNPAVSWWEE